MLSVNHNGLPDVQALCKAPQLALAEGGSALFEQTMLVMRLRVNVSAATTINPSIKS